MKPPKNISKFDWEDLNGETFKLVYFPADPEVAQFIEKAWLVKDDKAYVILEKNVMDQEERTFPTKVQMYEVAKKEFRSDHCRAAFFQGARWLKKELLKK